VVHGWATFRSPREIDVDGRVLTARRFIVATGTEPAVPPIDGLDAADYLTNQNVFELESLPESLVVLGGGAIGCELAQAFVHGNARELYGLDIPDEQPRGSDESAG
jgi:pyruvate/2-oxoglutarate dehydrogenase complex dihydrolipoamide dehydrogenase (E3) component